MAQRIGKIDHQPSTPLDHLTLPYWWLLEQRQLIHLDRHMGIRGPWWTRRRQRLAYWGHIAETYMGDGS